MSARPGNWGLVGYGSDPLPGDVTEVEAQARSYRDVAAEIDAQISRLKQIATGDDGQRGQYVDPLRDSASELSGELTKIQNRFDTVAAQLTTWAGTLDEGRSRSATILQQAEDAHHRVTSNAPPDTPLPDDASQSEIDADTARSKRYSAANSDLQDAVDAMRDLMDGTRNPPGVNDVARKVAGAINDAAHDSVKDSWWDSHVRKWVHDHAHLIEVIVKIIAVVAIVIAVAALILATGGFGLLALAGVAAETLATMASVATILETVGAVLGATMLVAQAAEMNAGVNGVGWGDIAMDVVGLVTFGAGRVLGTAAKGAVVSASSTLRSSAVADAVAKLPNTVSNALRIGSDTNPLKVWALAQRSAAMEAASSPIESALTSFETLSRAQRSLRILTAGSTELAEQATVLRSLSHLAPTAFSSLVNVNRLQSVIAIAEDGKTVFEGTKLPSELHEVASLLSGEGGEGGE